MKKYVIILAIIGIIAGFLIGNYLEKINRLKNNDSIIAKNVFNEIKTTNQNDTIMVVNSEEKKTLPDCIIILKIYHKACNHIIESKRNIEKDEINLTKKEIKEKLSEWEVQKFTPKEIILYKEVEEFCDEHYVLRDVDGYIVIYQLNEKGEENLFNKTEITTKYLPKEDVEKLRLGLKVFTDKELNKVLEDFE